MTKILIVEDDPVQLNALSCILDSAFQGIKIYQAGTFQEALQIIRTTKIHLFLLDISLKQGASENGVELGRIIRAMPVHTYTPIVYITSVYSEITSAINDTHCYSYITKPYTIEDIRQTVGSLLVSPMIPSYQFECKNIDGIYFRMKATDIGYIKASGHLLNIAATTGSVVTREHSIRSFLKDYPSLLVQCHRSYAINIHKILTYDRTNCYIHLDGFPSTLIPVGRLYKKHLEERLLLHD